MILHILAISCNILQYLAISCNSLQGKPGMFKDTHNLDNFGMYSTPADRPASRKKFTGASGLGLLVLCITKVLTPGPAHLSHGESIKIMFDKICSVIICSPTMNLSETHYEDIPDQIIGFACTSEKRLQ